MALGSEFIVYVADNVLVMLVACTTSYLGVTLVDRKGPDDLPEIAEAAIGGTINFGLTIVLFLVCRERLEYLQDEQDELSTSDEEKMFLADRKVAWQHILTMAPWIARLGAINFFQAICNIYFASCAPDPDLGPLFIYFFFTFIGMFIASWYLSRWWARITAAGGDEKRLHVFILDLLQGSLLSCSGKAAHYVVWVMFKGVFSDTSTENELIRNVFKQIILMVFSAWLLGYALPRFSLKTEEDKVSHTVMAYLVVYAWAFSFVDFLWWYFFTYLNSLTLYWVVVFSLLPVVLVLGCVTNNLYGGPGEWSKTFGNMVCWTIDFGVWWGWCQVMTDMDNYFKGAGYSHWGIFFLNLFVTLVLLGITAGCYVLSDHEHMLYHDFERACPVPNEAFAFGEDLGKVFQKRVIMLGDVDAE